MQNKQLESKKKKLLDFLYDKKKRASSFYKLEKDQKNKDYLLWVYDAIDQTILFIVDEPCMQWPL